MSTQTMSSAVSQPATETIHPAWVRVTHWINVVAMVLMIVLLDQLLWRPLVAWAQKFRTEEGASGEVPTALQPWLNRIWRV